MSNSLKIYLLTLISFLAGTSQFIIAGVLDKIATALNITVATAGQLVTVFALASAIGTPILTLLFSKYSLKVQLLIALYIFLFGIFLTPLNFGYEILIIARVITGVGTIYFVVISYILASRLAKEGKQGSAMANIALGFSLSLVAGVPIGRAIANIYNWQMIFYIIGVLVFLGLIAIILTFKNRQPDIVPSIKERLNILKDKRVFLSLSITVFVFTAFSSITTFITPLLFSVEKISEHTIAVIFTILGVASVIGSKLGATIADKIGVARVLLSTLFIIIITLIAMNIFSNSITIFVFMLTIWTMAMWMFGPTQSYNLSILIPKSAPMLLSLNSSFVQLGFALGAFIGGVTISLFSISTILVVGIVSILIAMILYFITLNI